MGEPVRDFEERVVEDGTGKERHEELGGDDELQSRVVQKEQHRENMPSTADVVQVAKIAGAKMAAVEDAVVSQVILLDARKEREAFVHGHPVAPELKKLRVGEANQ